MAPRIHGVETEYGLVGASDGRRLPIDEAATRLFAPIARRHATTNLFHRAGGRLYLDIGSHPEYATPECTSARDLVTAQRAGDALLLELADRARMAEAEEGCDTTFRLFRNNIDAFGNTWGSHENHLVARSTDPRVLSDWLVPFLVSRLLIGGTGRWRRGTFTLSQRGDVLGDLVSSQTTRSRPLINTRDEPHADPERHRRLHVISGDTNSLDHPMWLVIVATELVLRCAEAGGTPPAGPVDPLAALRTWNLDPDAGVPATDGGNVTARGLQRTYLDLATGHADDADETGPGWRAWADALDALDAGRPSGLEWDAKLRTIRAWRDRHGVDDTDPRLDALDLRWHELGAEAGRPIGLAALWEARHGVRHTTDEAVAAARA
ncbi:MAG TPA: proteasome accessory factor PafA2 family protein, partial [Propionibacterium sp.]|nr:proteasome accessory factor PafA2 family protein [Propionibacterium sp.]